MEINRQYIVSKGLSGKIRNPEHWLSGKGLMTHIILGSIFSIRAKGIQGLRVSLKRKQLKGELRFKLIEFKGYKING